MNGRKCTNTVALMIVAAFFGTPADSSAQALHNIRGWSGASVYFPGNANGTASDINIDGQVGYSLSVDAPRANCSVAGGWQAATSIVSGSLPPGLSIESPAPIISGVPTERGHWVVTLQLDPIYCGGKSFWGFQQKLYFHISGSGKVIQ
ncbi:MAG TPA: putative Ig domain-containing protein [Noviherbaspirillum sp.]